MSGPILTVGVPREIKPCEKRTGLTPRGVRTLTEAGVPVFIEKGAGEASGYSDKQYEEAGARIAFRPAELYKKSELIKKVKEPLPSEWGRLQSKHLLLCFLHLASPENRKLVEVLLNKKLVGIGLETMEREGRTICLEPMSEIAGTVAGYVAGFFRASVSVKEGKVVYPLRLLEKLEWLASQYPKIPDNLSPGRAVIFGGGTVGRKAAETLLKMGGEVDLVEKREDRRRELLDEFKNFGLHFRIWAVGDRLEGPLREADVWLGCVHVVGKRAPLVISREELGQLSRNKRKLIIDIAVDQGGNFPETRSSTYENPLYLDSFGNFRFAVANVPSLCGRGASEALERATLSYTLHLAKDWRKALRELPELQRGLQIWEGKLVNEAVAMAHQLPWEPARL